MKAPWAALRKALDHESKPKFVTLHIIRKSIGNYQNYS